MRLTVAFVRLVTIVLLKALLYALMVTFLHWAPQTVKCVQSGMLVPYPSSPLYPVQGGNTQEGLLGHWFALTVPLGTTVLI